MNALSFGKHIYFLRTETDRLLASSMLFSILLVVASLTHTSYPGSLFLVWNLFLAYIPYAISNWIQYQPSYLASRWKFLLLFIAWLFFIPNSFYILTDLFHLGEVRNLPLWYHLIMLISFAWNGLLLGIVSVRQMEKIFEAKWGRFTPGLFIYPIMWLSALGIYLGRYLRFNSWNLLTKPLDLFSDIIMMLVHPFQFKGAWGMVLCFSIFMTLVYIIFKKIGKMIS